jgi:hypothetical protein
VDTRFGYAILLRTPSTERERFVASAIKLESLPGQTPEHEMSPDNVGKRAQEIARELAVHPERFADFQRQYRSEKVEQWTLGRVPFGLTKTLSSLQVGKIASEAVLSDRQFWILKRLGAESAPPQREEVRFELPSPDFPDVAYFVKVGSPPHLRDTMVKVKADALEALPRASAKELERVQDAFVEAIQAPQEPEQRLSKYEQMLAELSRVLNPSNFEKYRTILYSKFEQTILRPHRAQPKMSDASGK